MISSSFEEIATTIVEERPFKVESVALLSNFCFNTAYISRTGSAPFCINLGVEAIMSQNLPIVIQHTHTHTHAHKNIPEYLNFTFK